MPWSTPTAAGSSSPRRPWPRRSGAWLRCRGTRRWCGREPRAARRLPAVGANWGAATARPWAVGAVEAAGRRVPIVSITGFPDPGDASWEGYCEALQQLLAGAALVVDLRGNGGGADGRGIELAGVLLGRRPDAYFDRVIRRQAPGTFALTLNAARLERFGRERRGEPIPPYLEAFEAQSLAFYRQALAGELPPREAYLPEPAEEVGGEPRFAGPVLILTDAACYSSCEATVLYLRQHPRAVTVGEATGGYLHFGDVGALVLPHSVLHVSLPTKYFEVRDAYYERTGIPADVPVPAGGDALEAALAWLGDRLPPT